MQCVALVAVVGRWRHRNDDVAGVACRAADRQVEAGRASQPTSEPLSDGGDVRIVCVDDDVGLGA